MEKYAAFWNWNVILYRGDEIIDSGTIKELAERRRVQKKTIYYYLMSVQARRDRGHRIVGVRND